MPAASAEILLAVFTGTGIGLWAGALIGGLVVLALLRQTEHMAADRAAAILRDIERTRHTPEPMSGGERRAIDAVMMTLASQRERLEEDLARLDHFRNGGRFDDSPTRWKNQQENKG